MHLHIYSPMYLYIDIEKLYMSPVTYVLLVTPGDEGVPDKIGGEKGKEMNTKIRKIFNSWRCFGKNPALATKILLNMVVVTLLRPITPPYVRFNMRGLEIPEECPEDAHTLAIGTALLYSLALVVGYLFIYLTYGALWR